MYFLFTRAVFSPSCYVDEDKAEADAIAEKEAKKKEVYETWVEKKDTEGTVYYFNVKTNETRRFSPFEGKHKLW